MQREIAQADLDANPILGELGGAVGDVVAVAKAEAKAAEETVIEEQTAA